jgi:hypothetical protein
MKVKDLMKFNPEAEIELLMSNFEEVELEVYAWECESDGSSEKETKRIKLIPKILHDAFDVKHEC